MRRYVDLFFMGAAFLLLETKNVVQFALLFGTTWFVNALVFAGVLLCVLAAVEVARHVRLPRPALLYVGAARRAGRGLGRPAGVAAVAVVAAAVRGRACARVRADLPGQPGLRPAVPRASAIDRSRSGRTCSARWSAASSSTSR